MYDYAAMTALVGIFIAVIAFFLVIDIALYIFKAIAVHKIAKKYGVSTPVLAWIPLVSSWTLGSIIDKIKRKNGQKSYFGITLLISNILTWIGFIAYIFTLVAFIAVMSANPYMFYTGAGVEAFISIFVWMIIAIMFMATFSSVVVVLSYMAYYTIYEDHSDSAFGLLIISIFFPIAIPFLLFSMRTKQPYSLESAPQDDSPYEQQQL